MADIATKTVGALIDELITAEMKIESGVSESTERRDQLMAHLAQSYEFETIWHVVRVIGQLWDVSERCFAAQDTIMTSNSSDDISSAAREAQLTNAMRNKCIRKIDEIAGQAAASPLGKTYG